MADIMADAMSDQPDLSALTGSPGQKRKRESASPETQRIKRAAPNANMSAAEFIENAIEANHAAAANGVNVADFNALQQAAAGGEHHEHQHQDQHEHHQHHDHHQHHEHQEHHHNPEHHIPEHHVHEGHTGEPVGEHHDVPDAGNATSTAQAALGMYPTLHVPASTEEQFAAQVAAEGEQHAHDNAFNPDVTQPDALLDDSGVGQHDPNGMPQGPRYSTSSARKPTVGSEEWHKMRKDNHKEVERRRRETINEGINELAKIVPGCEKNKGSILQRAVNFISQLKENEQQNIEKWTLEKLLTEQAITELSASNDKLKGECERLYRELETWKRVAQNAGLEPPQPTKEEPASSSAMANNAATVSAGDASVTS
ncbi:helix-loop-helix DNA-binding domain-containing protein [Sarocladium implicatum]|nr:helix-loop-helix DNA-binding domain-containing protein [Sarocladium implicatum]